MVPKRKSKATGKGVKATIINKRATGIKKTVVVEESPQPENTFSEEDLSMHSSEEEMGSEEEASLGTESLDEPAVDVGRIDLSFREATLEFGEKTAAQCYLPSYYTLSSKERLLLLYAENFRKQFVINNPNRRPLVLALYNECKVQKFVCSTIRPTAFLHVPLINSLEGCAAFVADFITYEPLKEVTKFPTRLISPATLLRRRCGNSFEMATLLCSMLLGAGFPAMVVSGVAREETVLNDQRNVPYPYELPEAEGVEAPESTTKVGQKYKLRPMPDLESHLEEHLAELLEQKETAQREIREEKERKEREEMELIAVDRHHYRRYHAWVVIIENALWSIKPKKIIKNEDGDVVESPPEACFIEPSTGFQCRSHCKQYILIDSVWNQYNYYVNRQKYQRVSDIRWDLGNTNDWEHLLPGEPPEMRAYEVASDEILTEERKPVEEEKHLDSICTWVDKLHIGSKEFEERFPQLQKTITYKRAIHERYSPYSEQNGKVMELTTFSDDAYKKKLVRYEFFEHRADLLYLVKYTFEESKFEESFKKGRNDNLKFMEYYRDRTKVKCLHFFSKPRLDSLKYLELHSDKIILHYSERSDRCYYQEFIFKPAGQKLKKILEKFHRNTRDKVPPEKDIAVRTFLLTQQKIFLNFHYSKGALTASTREFMKPPKPDYGKEIVYDPSLTKAYKANMSDLEPSRCEIYKLLMEQLQREDKVRKFFDNIMEQTVSLLDTRKQEMHNPILKFSIFDPLRNAAARTLRLKQQAEEEVYRQELTSKPADFLAPYLVPYGNRELTYEESWAALSACLTDLKTRFVGLLNELQRQYEDRTTEANSLRRFLDKFQNQFNDYDYDHLAQEAKEIGLNKRMVQQRLTLTHEESQKKYEFVKASLINDKRLHLCRDSD